MHNGVDPWRILENRLVFLLLHKLFQTFIHQITSQLSSGAKSDQSKYIKLTHENLEGYVFLMYILSDRIANHSIDSQRVRVNDKNGDVMFIVIPDMPDHIRKPLLNDLELSHPGVLESIDSKKEGEKAKFQHIHYQYWNRYHVNVSFSLYYRYMEILILLQGDGAPSDVDPAALKRAGTKRFNTSQTMPRTSTELQKNGHSYEQLQISLERLFDWLRQTVSNRNHFYMPVIIFFF